mmetsp:Transcript_8026/g.17388  ORF Transcript_8026/g.17388 Transcript_8026/m.17388 type:complete len:230 (+) Transcript_8026:399-1088(+)
MELLDGAACGTPLNLSPPPSCPPLLPWSSSVRRRFASPWTRGPDFLGSVPSSNQGALSALSRLGSEGAWPRSSSLLSGPRRPVVRRGKPRALGSSSRSSSRRPSRRRPSSPRAAPELASSVSSRRPSRQPEFEARDLAVLLLAASPTSSRKRSPRKTRSSPHSSPSAVLKSEVAFRRRCGGASRLFCVPSALIWSFSLLSPGGTFCLAPSNATRRGAVCLTSNVGEKKV